MDKNSIIDKETFEVYTYAEDHPKVFVCDKMIAPAIKRDIKHLQVVQAIIKLNFTNILMRILKT